VGLLNPYRPSIWTLFALLATLPYLLVVWVAVHPEMWGGREFEGMGQFIILAIFARACIPVVLICSVIGMIRKDPVAFLVFAATAALVTYHFMVRR
jgi:hypothetical protein